MLRRRIPKMALIVNANAAGELQQSAGSGIFADKLILIAAQRWIESSFRVHDNGVADKAVP